MIKRKLIVAIPLLLLTAVATTSIGTNQVKAWNYGPGGGCGFSCGGYGPSAYCGGAFSCCCDTDLNGGCPNGCQNFGDNYQCGAYCAGEQDAAYDIQNNLVYQPCHSEGYWGNFHQGYDSYWRSHQEQNEGASVNINGDNNYVAINQYQQQNPLQQLAHLACGFINCNGPAGPQGIGY